LRLEAEKVHKPFLCVAKFSIPCSSEDRFFDAKDKKDHVSLYKNTFLVEHLEKLRYKIAV
jgi:hypothetical protein